ERPRHRVLTGAALPCGYTPRRILADVHVEQPVVEIVIDPRHREHIAEVPALCEPYINTQQSVLTPGACQITDRSRNGLIASRAVDGAAIGSCSLPTILAPIEWIHTDQLTPTDG